VLFLSVRQTPDLTASAQRGIACEIPRQACRIARAGEASATLLGSARIGTELARMIPAFAGMPRVFGERFLPPACHRRFTVAA
jgi:hypothetical protein